AIGMVLPVRIELTTSPLPGGCSTTELRQHGSRAGGAGDTRGPAGWQAEHPEWRPCRHLVEPRFADPCLAIMVWHGSTIDPTRDVAASAVLDAFEEARNAGLPSVACYRAGVEAWRRIHRDHAAEYAARQAVAVILAAKVSLRVDQ